MPAVGNRRHRPGFMAPKCRNTVIETHRLAMRTLISLHLRYTVEITTEG